MLNLYEQQRLQKKQELIRLQELGKQHALEEYNKVKKEIPPKDSKVEDEVGTRSNCDTAIQNNTNDYFRSNSYVNPEDEDHSDSENDEVASFADEDDQVVRHSQRLTSTDGVATDTNNTMATEELRETKLTSTKRTLDAGDNFDYKSSEEEDSVDDSFRSKPNKQRKFAQI
jgi:hypothetical protein